MDWKKLFNPVILERGDDYYRNGNAEILSSMVDEVNAVVSGSDDYEVNIYFSDGEIEDMYCDCPYASDGNNCKHMAAVLYLLSKRLRMGESLFRLLRSGLTGHIFLAISFSKFEGLTL